MNSVASPPENAIKISYRPVPTVKKFHKSKAMVRILIGPVGSGKSVGCSVEILDKARKQKPFKFGKKKIRVSKWGVIRNTYPELKTTTIETFKSWVPEEICPLNYGAPIIGRMYRKLPDGTYIDMTVIFVSVDRPKDVKKLLSLELTGIWINEGRELSKSTLDQCVARVGRWPKKDEGGPSWSGVFVDSNSPDDDHWMYELEEKIKEDTSGEFIDLDTGEPLYEYFHQPPAVLDDGDGGYVPNPAAENVENQPLGMNYWLRQIPGKTRDWIKVFLQGKYGTIEDGKPVYPQYNDSLHCANSPIKPVAKQKLVIGFDFGLTPCATIGQKTKRGQLRLLDELVATDMGLRQFVRDILKPYLAENHRGLKLNKDIIFTGDPAGSTRSQNDAKSAFTILREEGITCLPAKTNSIQARIDAVDRFLTKLVDGEPGLLLSPTCRVIRKGFNGGYKLRRLQVSGEERYTNKPDKNRFSHPHDSLQYVALLVSGAIYDTSAKNSKADNNEPQEDKHGFTW